MCEALDTISLCRPRAASSHSFRQWGPLRQSSCPLQSVKTRCWMAEAGHCHRAHQTGPYPNRMAATSACTSRKKEATRPPGMNSLQQQARFDDFVHEFNAERPHEAIAMKCPAEVYTPLRRPYRALPTSNTPSTTATSSSPPAAASAGTERKSTSQPSWPDSASASGKSTREFGSSASSTMIWAISIWTREPCNPSTTPLGPGCHPCLKYVLLPMCPGRTDVDLADGEGFEPPVGVNPRRFSRPVP